MIAFVFLVSLWGNAKDSSPVEFKADYYERNLESDTVRGTGNAWIHSTDREVWAEEIEIDYRAKRAVARKNVRVRDADSDIQCRELNYSLDGRETILDEAVVVTGQMVLQGATITRIGKTHYEVDEGSYTNCNLETLPPDRAAECRYQWKIFGRRFTVDVGGYAHVVDALFLVKDQPVFYSPYLVLPIKTERQSGFLLPSFSSHGNKGTGISVPFYWALAPWQDLEVIPTYYSSTGIHTRWVHRYAYDKSSSGTTSFSLMQRALGDSPRREADRVDDPRLLGFVGGGAFLTRHHGVFHDRRRWFLDFRFVSTPIYVVDYGGDIDVHADSASIRSQVALNAGERDYSLGGAFYHYRSLVVSRDSGTDEGAVGQWPFLYYSRPAFILGSRWLGLEFESEFANFFRTGLGYDNVPDIVSTGKNTDANSDFDDNDFVRTGQRALVEPKLVMTLPSPDGIQIQPVLSVGAIGYHFAVPSNESVGRYYSNAEIPLTAYFSRTFRDASGIPQVSHVMQPRVVYSKNIWVNETPAHPFFRSTTGTSGFSPPGFDSKDLLSPHETLRFEFINRFRRWTSPQSSIRFLTLQLSEQLNIRNAQNDSRLSADPRYARRLGPIEGFSDFTLGRFSGQLQVLYQLETTPRKGTDFHESDWTGGVEYRLASQAAFSLSMKLQNRADETLSDQSSRFTFFKTFTHLPDLEGDIEYSIKRSKPIRYGLGATFYTRPRSCWSLTIRAGENNVLSEEHRVFYTSWSFTLQFGSPGALLRGA